VGARVIGLKILSVCDAIARARHCISEMGAALRLLSLDRCSIIRVCDANNSGHQEMQ